jgi:hypothetical protein
MPKTLLHDAGRGAELTRRVQALTPETLQRWGKMSVDQMLHHVNLSLAESLGGHSAKPNIRGLPEPLVRWAILNLPWRKGAMTGRHWSQLHYKHLNHHLTQFGV